MKPSGLCAPLLAALQLALPAAQAQNFDRLTAGLTDTFTDTLQTAIDLLPEGVTNIRLGLGPVVGPTYEGSDDYKVCGSKSNFKLGWFVYLGYSCSRHSGRAYASKF